MGKILIVDDDSAMSRLYKSAFTLSGYDAKTAADGKEALEKLSVPEDKPDIIFLDMMMPKLNGFDVLEHIKKDNRLKDIPVIALTNISSLPEGPHDFQKIRSLGAVDIIIKSQADPQKVVARAAEIIASRR